ncbi:transcriptional corepressor of histone-like protein genes [Macroventuria anomochaeta]|uniref:Transcriptional corepressor of histone-like protein genes n=1 Tax=Macroventuria anomochaeta TaxID=301207 RepID=A0ACB6SJU5_9PLEO|nr:transcriptional corepressor of histone-like protein genes [Macroventuria anomochaeta]KAF2633972.1 transcriptional corepressor of histone-like protein genes [Macroventuria anomochaeta]
MSRPQKASKASAWHALNVESDHEDEDEVDDTQEIQIEEALKLYQTALKYHSEGPQSFLKTAAAYKELFDSEIFKYNESLSEYKRHEVFGESLVFDSILEDDFEAGPTQTTGAADSAPNTLPQILHLSYKNHGQFLLESMQHWVTQHGAIPQADGWNNIRGALNYFAEALDKEDTDLDLWLRAASVAAMLGSSRLARYCLEAVMDGNDELWESSLRLPGLEEGLAGQQLRELVGRLEDNVSMMQPPLSTMKRKKLSESLKKRLNPCPFAPLPADVAEINSGRAIEQAPNHIALAPAKWDWSSVGEAILQHFIAEQRGITGITTPGSNVQLVIPAECKTPEHIDPEPAPEPAPAPALEEPMNDQPSPPQVVEPPSPAAEVKSTTKEEDNVEPAQEDNDQGAEASTITEVAPAPSRKRSTDSAGLPETTEGGRAKRIRTRNTATGQVGETVVQDASSVLEGQLEHYAHADQCLFEIVNDIYNRLGVEGLGQPNELRSLLLALPESTATEIDDKAACDMYLALQNGNSKAAQVLLSSESFDLVGVTREAGLNAFLGYAKSGAGQSSPKPVLQDQGLRAFARSINESWLSIKEVAFAWVEALLSQWSFAGQESSHDGSPSYLGFKWAEDLKRNIVQIIVNVDEYIFECMQERISHLDERILKTQLQSQSYTLSDFDASQIEIVQTLFELHLDIYSLIKHPHSQVDAATKTLQSDRLERWSTLAREAIQLRSNCDQDIVMDDLSLRHIWASVFQMSVKDDISPEHVLSAIAELKAIFVALDDRTIQVQNNAVMPELSVAALDRELARISMKDFFLKVFDHDEKDPVTVIESLEPILEHYDAEQPATELSADEEATLERATTLADSNQVDTPGSQLEVGPDRPSPVVEMRKFLDSANVNVRLSLWQRLREAYDAIDYPPKVLSCYLWSIKAFVDDFETTSFQELSLVERQIKLLTRFRVIDEMVVKIVQIMRGETTAFDCLSYEHVQSSMAAIAKLLHILSAANMFRDLIRIGKIPIPRIEGLPAQAFINMSTRLDDIQMRLWTLQYYLLREGLSQNPEGFPTPSEDLFEFLRHVHHATGIRGFCHLSGRQFLRLAKDEILRLDDVIDANSRDTELCQVLHDLYGLKLFIEPLECQDFSSTPDVLDKKAAFNLLPFVMSQAAKVDLKDLPKTKQELRATIEKVHAALGRPKQHDDVTFNRKAITTYFKSPIHPTTLFNCLKGVGSLVTRAIPDEEAVAASKSWFFLMGNIALSKFRSQKRMTQGPTEDLNYAQAFFLQDLEYSTERWETWYRLAQAYDTQLEEAVSWNADKINSSTIELANLQRGAINCYAMGIACATREASASSRDQAQIAQMYTEFGDRIYASSREPFNMEAFHTRDGERRFVNVPGLSGAQRDIPFVALQPYTAWKLASTLYKRAIKNNSDKWWNHYMLAKSLWKMWTANHNAMVAAASSGTVPPDYTGPSWEEVIKPVVGAIERLPGKKGKSGEPILEPHYKLISIVHKLVQRRAIDHQKGAEVLSNTYYSKNIGPPENPDEWERYILTVIKALRTADKSSWHHRIIARSAHILYDDGKDLVQAHAAKHELTQTIFTKTMAVQVWKPEYERPGRHFVYTLRYTKFFIDLLDKTGDKANLEALARRVRRKQTDFFQHTELWKDLCTRYLRSLRHQGNVKEGQEDSAFKSVNQEDFNALAARLEAWCQSPSTQHPVLDVLRDAIELKRLNNGLMKTTTIDDLIGDSYAMLYTTIGPTLPPLPSEQQQQQPPQLGQSGTVTPQPPTNPLSVASLIQVQVDGTTEGHNTPFAIYHSSQLHPQHPPPLPQAPSQPEQPAKPRAKAVGKREIQRRAEACVQKSAVASTPQQTTSMPIRSPPVSNATIPSLFQRQSTDKPDQSASLTPGAGLGASLLATSASFDSAPGTATASVNNDHSHDTDHDMDNDQDNDENEGDGEGDTEHAAPHDNDDDDADDESELSELDESEVQEIGQEVQEHDRRSASFATVKPMFPGLFAGRASAERVESSVPFGMAPAAGQAVLARGEEVGEGPGEKMDVDSKKKGRKQ